MTAIPITSEQQWHDLRAAHVGGSEVAALFNEHKQLTHWELHHIKGGDLPPHDLSDNERVFWGNVMEPAIARGIAEQHGWNIRKVRRYFSSDEVRGYGCTPDFEIVAHEDGPGVLEIKAVDWLVYKQWEGEPPLSFLLQLQSQLDLAVRPREAVR